MTEHPVEDRVPDVPRTGSRAVDDVLRSVAAAASAPLAEQASVFTEAHERLRRALDDLDHGDDAAAGGAAPAGA